MTLEVKREERIAVDPNLCMQKSRVSEEDEDDVDEGDVDDGKSQVPEPTSGKRALLTPGHATEGRRRSGKQMSIVVLLKF